MTFFFPPFLFKDVLDAARSAIAALGAGGAAAAGGGEGDSDGGSGSEYDFSDAGSGDSDDSDGRYVLMDPQREPNQHRSEAPHQGLRNA